MSPKDQIGSLNTLLKLVTPTTTHREQLIPCSLSKYSWLAYVMIMVEHEEKEVNTGLWKEILSQLKNQKGKVNVDAAIKVRKKHTFQF